MQLNHRRFEITRECGGERRRVEVLGCRERLPECDFRGRVKAERAPWGPPIFEINLRSIANGVIRIDELF
jgi:hypothetical protein